MAFVTINNQTTGNVQFNNAIRDVSAKESAGWREIAPGQKSFSFTVEGNQGTPFDKELENAWLNDLELDVKYGDGPAGSVDYEGKGYVTDFSRGGENEQNETFTATIEGTAAPTATTVT